MLTIFRRKSDGGILATKSEGTWHLFVWIQVNLPKTLDQPELILCPQHCRLRRIVIYLIRLLAPLRVVHPVDPALRLDCNTAMHISIHRSAIRCMLLILLQRNRAVELVACINDERLLVCEEIEFDASDIGAQTQYRE